MKTTQPVLARAIVTNDEALVIILADRNIAVPWDRCSTLLKNATPAQRRNADLSPGGYGIHWPDLDEDLSIGGLVEAAR